MPGCAVIACPDEVGVGSRHPKKSPGFSQEVVVAGVEDGAVGVIVVVESMVVVVVVLDGSRQPPNQP